MPIDTKQCGEEAGRSWDGPVASLRTFSWRWLMGLAAWNGGQDCSHPYGARFTDLRVFSELPSLYPEAEAQAKRRVREPEPTRQWGVMRNGLSRALARGCRAG